MMDTIKTCNQMVKFSNSCMIHNYAYHKVQGNRIIIYLNWMNNLSFLASKQHAMPSMFILFYFLVQLLLSHKFTTIIYH